MRDGERWMRANRRFGVEICQRMLLIAPSPHKPSVHQEHNSLILDH
jgi:hypothetical protein